MDLNLFYKINNFLIYLNLRQYNEYDNATANVL